MEQLQQGFSESTQRPGSYGIIESAKSLKFNTKIDQ